MSKSNKHTLSDAQFVLVQQPLGTKIFLVGPAGVGKTTAGVERLLHLLDLGVPARSILVITPQRTLAAPYYAALRRPTVDAGGEATLTTVGGLAQRMVDLFWPMIAEEASFAHPERPPTFLTLETAQYYMARIVRPLLDESYFESVTIDRNRLYSQIIDNLNKAAVVGFPYTDIGRRLKDAWGGEESHKRIYEQAQICANRFRRYCLDHNLLDFSLQVEVFLDHLWNRPICRDYLLETYTHLIVDNVEEDTPAAHDLLRDWLPHCDSALLIYDQNAGYRRFLGADPEGASALQELCDERVLFDTSSPEVSTVMSPDMQALADRLARSLNHHPRREDAGGNPRLALEYELRRYHPQMLDWVAERIDELVHGQGTPPGEIVVLAPFLSDALRFALTTRLEQRSIPTRSHRPSRALRDEPATHCLLTLAAIARPEWGIQPGSFDLAYALMQAIDGMDLVRAQLLAEIVYRTQDGLSTLGSFDQINTDMQERLTFTLGERYERLRIWIEEQKQGAKGRRGEGEPPDHFLSRMFGELLSQAGYGFHQDYDAGEVAANLIESMRKFRWATEEAEFFSINSASLGREYVEMVEDGVIAAQYVRSWRPQSEEAVLLAPAYTFIIRNRPVDYQFWLNVGGQGWWERLYQPLTHPYVLSRHWPPPDRPDPTWSDADEIETRRDALYRLVMGLTRRCRRKVYLGLSKLGEQGYEQKGPLMQAIQRVLRDLPKAAHLDSE